MKRFLVGSILLAPAAFAQLPPERTAQLYVSDFDNDRVVSYDEAMTVRSSFTGPGLNGPRGLVVGDAGTIWVASELSDLVLVFDAHERFQLAFGAAQLDGPTGMAFSPSGELYVSSYSNNRVCVFEPDGTFLRSFTLPGFSSPNCVAFDSAGFIYVTNALTDLVVKFTPAETLAGVFTAPAPFVLDSPMSIALHGEAPNEVLYISAGNSNNICLFDTAGNFLGQITHPHLPVPQGLAFDDRGHLFASSFSFNTLVEFDASGAWVRTILAGGLDAPRSLAFARLPSVPQHSRAASGLQPR